MIQDVGSFEIAGSGSRTDITGGLADHGCFIIPSSRCLVFSEWSFSESAGGLFRATGCLIVNLFNPIIGIEIVFNQWSHVPSGFFGSALWESGLVLSAFLAHGKLISL